MSVLEHLCLDCAHRLCIHDARSRGYTDCPCCNSSAGNPSRSPTLIETFSVPGHRIETLYAPGAARNRGTMHATNTCDCDDCHEMYARLVGEIAESGCR